MNYTNPSFWHYGAMLLGTYGAYKLSRSMEFTTEASSYRDKQLDFALNRIDDGIKDLLMKYPSMKRPTIKSGVRGTRYFIEFPIQQKNVDAFSMLVAVQSVLNQNKDKSKAKIKNNDAFKQDDMISYLIDYELESTTAKGAKSGGSIYIRGVQNDNYDSFKFVIEKNTDFHNVDVEIVLKAYEEAFKPKMKPMGVGSDRGNTNQSQGKSREWRNPLKGAFQGQNNPEDQDDSPQGILERHGCTVFVPGAKQNNLDWDYLAGYDYIKRDIEDTVLLALTHGHVYDQITQSTRMKDETNRPKCVLFEGPPGCGKTTSAKIISSQVKIPLIYMPLEAIMSKFYGESENRLAEIFEAAQGMGKCILFIDEIDSLATSRETGLHEATRRILSTLLRKIDSFESDGEVLVICATNRKKDLDPALVSRLDLAVRFELPDQKTRSLIFQRYAKQLSSEDLTKLGELAEHLSGRDI